MGFVQNKVLNRVPGSSMIGRLTDIAIVSGAGLRLAHRRGLVSDELAAKFGASDSAAGEGLSPKELILVGAAAFRLLGRLRKRS